MPCHVEHARRPPPGGSRTRSISLILRLVQAHGAADFKKSGAFSRAPSSPISTSERDCLNSARVAEAHPVRNEGRSRRPKRDCPHPPCMSYAQPKGNLWIKRGLGTGFKDTHRITPRLRPCFTGGFEALIPFVTNHLTYFSTKSGPTTTT